MGRLVRLLCSVLLPEGRGQEKVTKSLFLGKGEKGHYFLVKGYKVIVFFRKNLKIRKNLHLYLCAHVKSLHLLYIFQVEVL